MASAAEPGLPDSRRASVSDKSKEEKAGIKPVFWSKPKSMTVNRGDLVTIECRLMADPEPKVCKSNKFYYNKVIIDKFFSCQSILMKTIWNKRSEFIYA